MNELELLGIAGASFIAGGASVYLALNATIDRMAGRVAGRVNSWRPVGTSRVAVLARDVGPVPSHTTTLHKTAGPALFDFTRTGGAPTTQDAYVFRLAADGGGADSITITGRHLARFVGMDTITRANWSGDRAVYSQCLRVAQSRGWVTQRADGLNGVEWSADMRTLGRRVARLDLERITLPSPTRG